MDKNMDKPQAKKRHRVAKILTILAVIIIVLLLCLRGCSGPEPDNIVNNPFSMDESAEGLAEAKNQDDIREELNKKVADGEINISMNMYPEFENGESKGNLNIINEDINNYPQIVQIIRDDTEESIYQSKGIPVGKRIAEAKLDIVLDKGEYPCTAFFSNVDPATGANLGTAGAKITIKIKN